MKRVLVVAAIASFMLAGCATKKEHHHHTASYDQGFSDGCESGIWYDLTEIKVKDYQRAANEKGYFYGWDEGFTECRYNIYRKKPCT